MKFLKAFNKEQVTLAGTVALCLFLLAGGLLGGRSATVAAPVAAGERSFEPPAVRYSESLSDDFTRYWAGTPIFRAELTTKLPIPVIPVPEPRPEEVAAPLLRPGPALEAYNKLSLRAKYPSLVAGAPVFTQGLPATEVEALKKLEEPVVKPRADRRGERERPFAAVILKTGVKREGEILRATPAVVEIKNKDTGQREAWPMDQVLKVEHNRTNLEQYELDSRAVPAGPQEAQHRTRLAQRLLDFGMLPEARQELRRAIEAKKDQLEAYLLLGRIHAEEQDFEAALATYESGLSSGAPPADLHYETGRCLRALSFHEGAAGAFERALDVSPRHQKAKAGLARAQLDLGQHAAAVATAGDFFAKLAGASDTAPEDKVEAQVVRGLAYLGGGDLARARADLAEALKLDPQNAEAMNAAAVVTALEGNLPDAGNGFLAAIRAQQYLVEAWLNAGALQLLAGKWADAEAIYAGAAQRDPTSGEALYGIALSQVMGGKPEGAAALEKALQVEPRNAAAKAVAGILKLRAGASEEALGQFVDSLRIDYSYLPAYYGAATAYLRSAAKAAEKDEAKAAELRVSAETLLRTLRDSDPARSTPWTALACSYAVMGRPDDARAALREAVDRLQQESRKHDPLVQYVQGYVDYWHAPAENEDKRLELAASAFAQGVKLEAEAKDPFSARVVAECKRVVELIEDWKATSVRVDERFEAEPSDVIGSNWTEGDDQYNVAIRRVQVQGRGGVCRFAGKQEKVDMGITILEREIPPDDFWALEATFFPEKVERTEYGMSIYYGRQGTALVGFHVGVREGRVRFSPRASYPNDMDRKDMLIPGWTELKTPLPDPAKVTFRITRTEKNRANLFTIWFWDPAKAEWIAAQKDVTVAGGAPGKALWRIAFFGRAWRDQEYAFSLDDVRVYERERRGP